MSDTEKLDKALKENEELKKEISELRKSLKIIKQVLASLPAASWRDG